MSVERKRPPIVARSTITPTWDYTVQIQAKAGNWVDSLSCNSSEDAMSYAQHCMDIHGETVRVVNNHR